MILLRMEFYFLGGVTAFVALSPLFVSSFLLYSGWTRLQEVDVEQYGVV